MPIIPAPPDDDQTITIHGCPWRHVFRVRDGVAFTWYRRYRMWIPLEEFLSMGNLTIVRAACRYTPVDEMVGPALPFPIYLAKCLHHDMSKVVRYEWSGWAMYEHSEERDTTGRRKVIRRTFQTPAIEPLPADEIDDTTDAVPTQTPAALRTTVPYEDRITITEALQFVQSHVNGKRLDYLARVMQEDEIREIGRDCGVAYQVVQNSLRKTRQQLTRWADEISDAAAD